MSTEPITPKELHEALTLVLEPRPPAEADLIYAYSLIAQTSTGAYAGFHFWAAGIDPAAEDAFVQLASYLATQPTTRRSRHVHRACLSLSVYARGGDLSASWRVRDELSVLFLLWAAITCPGGPASVVRLCNKAFEVDPTMATTSDLYPVALRRVASPSIAKESKA